MKRNIIVFFITVLVSTALLAGNARCDTWTTDYSYYRDPNPDSRAWINIQTRTNGLFAYDPTAGTGPEGNFLPGSEPSTLQRGYDETRRWDWGWPSTPSPWAIRTSERYFESSDKVSFAYPDFTPIPSSMTFYPYPAQNPHYSVSGYAQAGNLMVGGSTSALATGNRMPPVAKVSESVNIKNSFTVNPGSSAYQTGDTVGLTLRFRLDGLLTANEHAHSFMNGGLRVSGGPEVWVDNGEGGGWWEVPNVVSVAGYADLYNNYNSLTSGYSYLSVSTNDGTASESGSNVSPSLYGYDTGLLTLDFLGIVGTMYDVSLGLSLLSEAYGQEDPLIGGSRVDFSNTFGASITGADGIELSWAVPQSAPDSVPVPAAIYLLGSGLAGMWCLRRKKSS
jgi:hypothetical protein